MKMPRFQGNVNEPTLLSMTIFKLKTSQSNGLKPAKDLDILVLLVLLFWTFLSR